MMSKEWQLNILRELLWWAATFVVAFLILVPIYGTINNDYLQINLFMNLVALTYLRYILFLNHIPYLRTLIARVILIIIVGLSFWQFVTKLQQFLFVIDNYTISTFLVPEKIFIDSDAMQDAYHYFKQEYLLFNLSVLILSVVLVLRGTGSLWKLGKKG